MISHDYLMGFARHAATASEDSTKVGAALVSPERVVRLTAFNGAPIGVLDSPERKERPTKYLFTSHAEENLVAFAARYHIRTEGCRVYTTHHPCARCARSLIQAGVEHVFYAEATFGPGSPIGDEVEVAARMLHEAGVGLTHLPTASTSA